ncbi:MAG: ABC transporter ATP-binding protein [Synergistetes bacterium]|nr:ABC transporter ATP-binding protein [Synergistota bacterium]MCX8127284.1 ABC transporter ATP-binding protein [Synergistota bacterium]MDW8191830.1 ABC transporter ATP-binding protein [Synergistota bacterium]
MLEIKDLWVEVGGKPLLKGINLVIEEGEVHILFGPNGSGKTTLLMTIMGSTNCKIIKGEIRFYGKVINDLPVWERAKLGIGMAFQTPPAVKGVKLKDLIKVLSGGDGFSDDLYSFLRLEEHANREINKGFSGGERKRSELLQLFAQNPKFVMFDEPESGVDLESIALIGEAINRLLERGSCVKKHTKSCGKSALIVSHTGYLLDYVKVDKAHVLVDGKLICNKNPWDILATIREQGYKECEICKGNF